MKARLIVSLLLFTSTVIISCSKDGDNPDDQQPNSEGSLFVKMQQGIIPGDDTLYLMSYDANKRLQKIIISSWEDTITPAYDNIGNLSSLKRSSYPNASLTFTFDAANQLTAAEINNHGKERWLFEYTNGIPSKKNHYIQVYANNEELFLWKYYTYEVTNGNITGIKEYNAAGDLLGETKLTYTSEPNVFKPIALFNFSNNLGLEDLASFETSFNKNLIASSSEGDDQTTYTYTYNSNKHLTKFIVKNPYGLYTRMLSY